MSLQDEQLIAVETIVSNKVKIMGLHEFESQARLAASNQFKRDPASSHRAIEAGVECAHRYETQYLK